MAAARTIKIIVKTDKKRKGTIPRSIIRKVVKEVFGASDASKPAQAVMR